MKKRKLTSTSSLESLVGIGHYPQLYISLHIFKPNFSRQIVRPTGVSNHLNIARQHFTFLILSLEFIFMALEDSQFT